MSRSRSEGLHTILTSSSSISYIRKVYAWLLVGVALCAGSATMALRLGVPVQTTFDHETVTVPPLVAAIVEHVWLASGLFLLLVVAAAFARQARGMLIPLYVLFTSFTGLFIGPSIFLAQLSASQGGTLSGHPLRDALILTATTFGGLTAYVMASGKDFSSWRSFLVSGLWVLIGALFLSIFMASNAMNLAISSVAVLLFAGFIVFDTSIIMKKSDQDEPISDALNLFLDLLNMFLHLLRILSAKK